MARHARGHVTRRRKTINTVKRGRWKTVTKNATQAAKRYFDRKYIDLA